MHLERAKNVLYGVLRAGYAQAAKTKAKPKAKATLPQKQQFRKRFKEATQVQDAGSNANTQREALIGALFKVQNSAGDEAKDVTGMEQRALIAKAWSRLQMLRLHAQTTWELSFVASKLDAIKELRKISPELATMAEEIDYSIPPTHRRILTDTPPHPSKFPFEQ